MRDCIENWLNQDLIKIIEEDQVEAVGNSHVNTSKENKKGTYINK
jgi:hypothetical protein